MRSEKGKGVGNRFLRKRLPTPFIVVALLVAGSALGADGQPRTSLPEPVMEAQRLSGRADMLAADGREREAAQRYLEAHLKFQSVMEKFFELAYRASIQGRPAYYDQLLDTDRTVAELRDLNLMKLWLILDPEDRAYVLRAESERAALIRQFPDFSTPAAGRALEEFLAKLYVEEAQSSRHLDVLREGRMPVSARWSRLEQTGR